MKKGMISLMLILTLLMGMIGCTPGSTGDVTDPITVNTKEDPTEAPTGAPTDSITEAPTATPTESTTDSETQAPDNTGLDKNKTYNVLFVGNSFTHYNDMSTTLFRGIATGAGYKVNVESIHKGGYYLDQHADPSDQNTGARLDAALRDNKYDFVILQEQSACPIIDPARFYDATRNLVKRIRENGATPILYETWSYRRDHSALSENGWTHESMTWKLAAAYKAIGEELDVDVVYVGVAFRDICVNETDIELYHTDKKHPSLAGSYLAGLSIFSHIFECDPAATTYRSTLLSTTVSRLKEAAKKVVFETPEVPAEYLTESEGVTSEGRNVYGVDYSKMNNLKSFPTSEIISVLKGGTYPNGKNFSGILGTLGKVASTEYSTTGLTDAQKADIANIGYGVSIIGVERMDSGAKGYTTAIENFVNGHWGSSMMANVIFDDQKYDIKGNPSADGRYTSLITLNFGSKYSFDAFGFFSGSLQGFPGVAEVFVSDDGENWTIVPTACWDNVYGTKLSNCGKSPEDPWQGNTSKVSCLFGMEGVTGQYIRVGVIVGRNDTPDKYNTINTRELVVYGTKVEQ